MLYNNGLLEMWRDCMLSFFSAAITAGIPGFMSYVYLSKIGVLNYTKDEKDEKFIVLMILSFLNMGVTYYVFRLISGVDPIKELTWINALSLFLVGVLVTTIMTNLYKFVINSFINDLEKSRLKENKMIKNNKSIYESALRKFGDKKVFVYIFDLKNGFIESGYFHHLDELGGKTRIGLSNNTYYTEEAPTITEVLKAFNEEEDTEKKEIIIDFDNQKKLFLFYV